MVGEGGEGLGAELNTSQRFIFHNMGEGGGLNLILRNALYSIIWGRVGG